MANKALTNVASISRICRSHNPTTTPSRADSSPMAVPTGGIVPRRPSTIRSHSISAAASVQSTPRRAAKGLTRMVLLVRRCRAVAIWIRILRCRTRGVRWVVLQGGF